MAYAIIVAGGAGSRMQAAEPKQYLKLNGAPILVHTLRAFYMTGMFKAIVLVMPARDLATRTADLAAYGKAGPVMYVPGGHCRQESVYHALQKLRPFVADDEIVCIHDAVRPIIDARQIYDCLQTAATYGAAVLGIPITETIKLCDEMGQVLKTVPRDNMWLAKTPQCMRFALLWHAHKQALARNIVATDDAALLECLDIPVHMVQGSRANVKITIPEDLHIAEKLL